MEGRGGERDDRFNFVEGECDNRFRYVKGESNAGYIYYCHGQQHFFSISAEADNPEYLPRNCTICDSNKGILLCYYPTPPVHNVARKRPYACAPVLVNAYFVCNPFIPISRRPFRNPPNGRHPVLIPRALVISSHLFHVVCALPKNPGSRTYSFEVYSSGTDEWTPSAPYDILGRIRGDTGVSCGSRAYWLLEGSPSAVSYDTVHDSVHYVSLPPSYGALLRQPDVRLRSQLGKVGRQLYFVAAKENWRAVYSNNDVESDWWDLSHERTYAYPQFPMLSRFEDGRMQVPFWFDSGVLVMWDSSWCDIPELSRIVYLKGPQRDLGADVLPLIHTQLNPLWDFWFSRG